VSSLFAAGFFVRLFKAIDDSEGPSNAGEYDNLVSEFVKPEKAGFVAGFRIGMKSAAASSPGIAEVQVGVLSIRWLRNQLVEGGLIISDGFENGDMSGWSD